MAHCRAYEPILFPFVRELETETLQMLGAELLQMGRLVVSCPKRNGATPNAFEAMNMEPQFSQFCLVFFLFVNRRRALENYPDILEKTSAMICDDSCFTTTRDNLTGKIMRQSPTLL